MTFDGALLSRHEVGRRLPSLVALLTAFLLATLGIVYSSAAGAAPAITVTPSGGLQDGQSVTVHGTGYTANAKNLNVIQCPVSGAGQNSCNVPDAKIFQSVDGSGSFTYTIVVRAKIGSIDCTKVPCMIDAHEGTSATSGNDASVVLHFGGITVTDSRSAPSGGSTSGPSGGSSGGNGTGTGATAAGTPAPGNPTGADTGYQDIGAPRIAVTLGLIGLGAVLLCIGMAVHLRRRAGTR